MKDRSIGDALLGRGRPTISKHQRLQDTSSSEKPAGDTLNCCFPSCKPPVGLLKISYHLLTITYSSRKCVCPTMFGPAHTGGKIANSLKQQKSAGDNRDERQGMLQIRVVCRQPPRAMFDKVRDEVLAFPCVALAAFVLHSRPPK